MNANEIGKKWLSYKDRIAELTYSKKGDVHELLDSYLRHGWIFDDTSTNLVSSYIRFLETELEYLTKCDIPAIKNNNL